MNHRSLPLPASVAVVGSNGAIGGAVVSALQIRGVTVYGFDIQLHNLAAEGTTYTRLPQDSPEEYVEAFAQRVGQLRPGALVVCVINFN